MAKKDEVFEVAKVDDGYQVVRKEDAVVFGRHGTKKDADHQCSGLNARAGR